MNDEITLTLREVENPSGKENLVKAESLITSGFTYVTSAACMSVWSEGLSFANKHRGKMVRFPQRADNIVVLSCQVTDLAVLNDLRTLEKLMENYPHKRYFIGGCLARRFDIPLPKGVMRLDTMRCDYQELYDRQIVNYEKPFWVPGFKESDKEMSDGNIFRKGYPLRIGVGCGRKCKYCTIRWTRGENYELNNIDLLEQEFLRYEDVVLIADNPSVMQIKAWCEIAIRNRKKISFRNVEPAAIKYVRQDLIRTAEKGYLDTLHCPIQSSDLDIVYDMKRDPKDLLQILNLVGNYLKPKGVKCATNVIIDYWDKEFDPVFKLKNNFDYISWNPYWDGQWDRAKAEERFQKYIINQNFNKEQIK